MARVQSPESRASSGVAPTKLWPLNSDHSFFAHASRISERGLGRCWPNPSVGCVLVKNGVIIAAARTADDGRPHAETEALEAAGDAARGATAYVTLEPCAHHGKTPPCAQALIDSGITRVVYGSDDPDPRVQGRGAAMLRDAGIDVLRITNNEWRTTHRGFFRRVRHGLPQVALKIATSADGYIADPSGAQRWLTGDMARAHGHVLRSRSDAVLTGIGTVLTDNPLYSVRLPGLNHPRLVRVVCDRQLRLPLTSQLVHSAEIQPVWVITTAHAVEQNASHATDLRERGVVLHVLEDTALVPHTILQILAAQGINNLLVEAGALLTEAFLKEKCVDTLHWYRAPMRFGNTGNAAKDALTTTLHQAVQNVSVHTQLLGPDSYTRYELNSCLPD